MKKVLVVDDEKLIVKGLKFSLEQDDMEVDTAYDGGEAIEKIKANDYDIVLLDIMIPVYTGIEVCQMVREFSNVPIIMLTAKGEDMDKIMGLEYGADDYITKPFNILEVKARIKAILRRSNRKQAPAKPSNVMEINGMKVELDSRRVFVGGKELNLTAKEFDLLELLIRVAQLFHDSRLKVLHHDVAVSDHFVDDVPALLQVDRNTFLAAVHQGIISALSVDKRAKDPASITCSRLLDFNDFGAKIRQVHGAERPS